jgi:hypothetical protein
VTAALVITPRDNVATALESIDAGRAIRIGDSTVTATEPIPRGHKLALRAIRAGEPIVKYGSPIGNASVDIAPGAHVHTHNVASTRGRGDLRSAPGGQPPDSDAAARIAEPPDRDEPEPTAARRER